MLSSQSGAAKCCQCCIWDITLDFVRIERGDDHIVSEAPVCSVPNIVDIVQIHSRTAVCIFRMINAEIYQNAFSQTILRHLVANRRNTADDVCPLNARKAKSCLTIGGGDRGCGTGLV